MELKIYKEKQLHIFLKSHQNIIFPDVNFLKQYIDNINIIYIKNGKINTSVGFRSYNDNPDVIKMANGRIYSMSSIIIKTIEVEERVFNDYWRKKKLNNIKCKIMKS